MLDPVLLKTFLVIAEGNSFSETSRKLAMRQSTVSDHVRRLEQHLGRSAHGTAAAFGAGNLRDGVKAEPGFGVRAPVALSSLSRSR